MLAAKLLTLMLIIANASVVQYPVVNESFMTSMATGIELEVDFGNGTISHFSNLEGTNVLNVTQSQMDITVEWYGIYAYVVSIEGVQNDDELGLYWQYWINDQFAPVAANLMSVENGDHIVWRRTSSSFTPPTTSYNDPTAIIGILSLLIIGPSFLGILYLTTMRRMNRL